MNSINGDRKKGMPFGVDEDGTVLNPRIMARVARLLRWYPRTWRDRYGTEFEAVLTSSLVDGKGGLSLSMNVAREGLAARLESAGFVGRTSPVIERARASVMTVFVATLGFLTSAVALLIYSKGWQASPRIEALRNADTVLMRSKAFHAFSKVMSSPLDRRIQLAAVHSGNGNSPAWRALYKFQDKARSALENSAAGHAFTRVMSTARPASGTPVIFNHVAYYLTGVAIICVAAALIYLVVTAVSGQWRIDRKPLLGPIGLLSASSIFFVLASVAYHAFEQRPPGEPAAWKSLRLLMEGQLQFLAGSSLSALRRDLDGSRHDRRTETTATSGLHVSALSRRELVGSCARGVPGYCRHLYGRVGGDPHGAGSRLPYVKRRRTLWNVVSSNLSRRDRPDGRDIVGRRLTLRPVRENHSSCLSTARTFNPMSRG